jgi:hypothetical protein
MAKETVGQNQELKRIANLEFEAYENYNGPDLPFELNSQLLKLFLIGKNTKEIHELNPELEYGAIVRAKINSNWPAQKESYLQNLFEEAKLEAVQAQLGGVKFINLAMNAFHKLAGNKFLKYIQTGDETELGQFARINIKDYKLLVDSLQSLSGENQKSLIKGEFIHKVINESKGEIVDAKLLEIQQGLNEEQSKLLMDYLIAEDEKES